MVIEIPRMQNRAGILLLQSRYEIHLPPLGGFKIIGSANRGIFSEMPIGSKNCINF